MTARRASACAALVLAAGCRPGAPSRSPGPTPPPSATSRCVAVPAGSLAHAPGEPCGQALVGGAAPTLLSLATGAVGIPVQLPEACAEGTCDYELRPTRLGLLIAASRRGVAGEGPDWVGLGLLLAGTYRFVDTWIGRPVATDFTPAGPAFELAPHACAAGLALLAVPRAGRAAGEDPEPAVRAAEGVYTWVDGGLVVTPTDPASCSLLPAAAQNGT